MTPITLKAPYCLQRPARELLIGRVVRLIDRSLAPIRCVSQSAYTRFSCPDEAHYGLRLLMLDVWTAISGIQNRHSLADRVTVTL